MVCQNCGKNLIRGYSFCLDCGSPVPPEVLEEGGMPGRTPDNGNSGDAAAKNGESRETESEAPVSEVKSAMPGISSYNSGDSNERLVFCPNCGMSMQNNSFRCEKCGMPLSDKASNIPLSSGGVPLLNTDPMPIDGLGGDFGGLSDNDINQINDFMNGGGIMPSFADGNDADLFGGGMISANDFAALTEQLANFSASTGEMPSISVHEQTNSRVHQQEPKEGEERLVMDFAMNGDPVDGILPISDGAVPVIDGCSMEEDPSADISLDPYAFLNNSMDEVWPEENKTEPLSPMEPVAEEPAADQTKELAAEELAAEQTEELAAEEPAAEQTAEPVAEELAAEQTAEPVAEEPAAEQTAEPVAEEPAAEQTAEPVAEEPAAVQTAEPVAEEPAAEQTAEPVAEEPAAEQTAEPVAEEPAAEQTAEPVAEEPAAVQTAESVTPVYEEPKADSSYGNDYFFVEEAPFIAESAPVITEFIPSQPEASAESAPKPSPAASVNHISEENYDGPVPVRHPYAAPPKPSAKYCRSCGQDMFEGENFCTNCGAPYKGAYVPPKQEKKKLFGLFSRK